MRAVDLILQKRRGQKLAASDIQSFIQRYTQGDIPDYQMAAMAMAICFQGLDAQERHAWTEAMLRSGQVLTWEQAPGPLVDKHSTGGVGDKVSLILGPLCAAAGLCVPMISGRGLGHTGGTLDKLESLKGFDTRLSLERLRQVVRSCGVAITGQTGEIAPADQKLYALRDVTGTIDELSLITSSIMSKKLAEGLDGLVLDVKVGNGAFMKDTESARALASMLVETGQAMGVKVRALLTDMSQPLGKTIGNALELAEALEVLDGGGPADLVELTCELAAEMMHLGGLVGDLEQGRQRAGELLRGGQAMDRMRQMVQAQGGDLEQLCAQRLRATYHQEILMAPRAGYIHAIDSLALGQVAMELGAGRAKASDSIDHRVGLELHLKRGDKVELFDDLVTLHFNRETQLGELRSRALDAITIKPAPPEATALVMDRLG
jgi:pyrimidine-nucleoside phosphorylase